jgi:hypothetical protein
LYERIPLLNLEQALQLMDMYYTRVVRPVVTKSQSSKKGSSGKFKFNTNNPKFENLKFEVDQEGQHPGENVDMDNMEELFNKINGEMPILEHLDFVFCEYFQSEKMDFYQASHILYIFSKCGYTSMLKNNPSLAGTVSKPKILLKLIFALSKSKNFKNEKILWRTLELQILKHERIA